MIVSHSKVLVGIDPATAGSAVVLIGTSVPAVILWKKVTRKKRKVFSVSISFSNSKNVQTTLCRTPAHIGAVISGLSCLNIVNGISIEDCYFHKNPKTTIMLARFGTAVSAPLQIKCGFDPVFVAPTEWRKSVIGVRTRIKREEAKRLSLKHLPLLLPELEHHLNLLGRYDHITDAAGIALWLSYKYSK